MGIKKFQAVWGTLPPEQQEEFKQFAMAEGLDLSKILPASPLNSPTVQGNEPPANVGYIGPTPQTSALAAPQQIDQRSALEEFMFPKGLGRAANATTAGVVGGVLGSPLGPPGIAAGSAIGAGLYTLGAKVSDYAHDDEEPLQFAGHHVSRIAGSEMAGRFVDNSLDAILTAGPTTTLKAGRAVASAAPRLKEFARTKLQSSIDDVQAASNAANAAQRKSLASAVPPLREKLGSTVTALQDDITRAGEPYKAAQSKAATMRTSDDWKVLSDKKLVNAGQNANDNPVVNLVQDSMVDGDLDARLFAKNYHANRSALEARSGNSGRLKEAVKLTEKILAQEDKIAGITDSPVELKDVIAERVVPKVDKMLRGGLFVASAVKGNIAGMLAAAAGRGYSKPVIDSLMTNSVALKAYNTILKTAAASPTQELSPTAMKELAAAIPIYARAVSKALWDHGDMEGALEIDNKMNEGTGSISAGQR